MRWGGGLLPAVALARLDSPRHSCVASREARSPDMVPTAARTRPSFSRAPWPEANKPAMVGQVAFHRVALFM